MRAPGEPPWRVYNRVRSATMVRQRLREDAPMPAFDSASPAPDSSQFGVSSGHEYDPLFAGSADVPPPDRPFGRVGQVPCTLSQTIVGTAVTLVPWVTVLVPTHLTAPSSAGHT